MEEKKRLSIIVEHWIEHNQSHMGEYQKWAQTANELGFEMVKVEIEEAIEKLSQCNRHLEQALKKL